MTYLANLDDHPGKVLVVTDPNLMRAIDYRAPKCSINLLIMKQFGNLRAVVQGLGRVGRYGEACQRFKLKGLGDLVNRALQAKLANKVATQTQSKMKQLQAAQKAKEKQHAKAAELPPVVGSKRTHSQREPDGAD